MKRIPTLLLLSTILSLHADTLKSSIHTVIFAAGEGTRFTHQAGENKLLAHINKKPIIAHPVIATAQLNLPMTIVVGHQQDLIKQAVLEAAPEATITFATQEEQLGTGHALQCTRHFWQDAEYILIMNGDHPLTSQELLTTFIEQHMQANADFSLLVTRPTEPCRWGRLVQEDNKTRVVEAIDFTGNPKAHPFLNAGYYLIKRSFLEEHIDELWLHENKGEYYVTDLVEIASKHGLKINPVEVPYHCVHGVNNHQEFVYAQKLMDIASSDTQAVVLAAGKSSRFQGETSKLLTPICGDPIVFHPIKASCALHLPIVVVTGHQGDELRNSITQAMPKEDITFALQDKLIGTGYAMRCCLDQLHADNILILYGDHPTTNAQTLRAFIESHQKANATVSIIVCERTDPGSYGRIITKDGITRCVEAKDFYDDPHDYPLVNAGYYLIKRDLLVNHIDDLWLHKNKREYYVNDYIEIASRLGHKINTFTVDYDAVRGVNTQEEFAIAERILSNRT